MAKHHAPIFLEIVERARSLIEECSVDEVQSWLDSRAEISLIDVREESEFAAGHIPGSIHLGKGIIERDIEGAFPDPSMKLILYCGGGYRSALAAESLKQMGYTSVVSMWGGFRAWTESGLSVEL